MIARSTSNGADVELKKINMLLCNKVQSLSHRTRLMGKQLASGFTIDIEYKYISILYSTDHIQDIPGRMLCLKPLRENNEMIFSGQHQKQFRCLLFNSVKSELKSLEGKTLAKNFVW